MIDLLKNKKNKGKKLVALIDGEHYPQINYDAIKCLKKNYPGFFSGIIFLGGTEKLVTGNLDDFFKEKVFTIKDLDIDFIKALDLFKPDLVYDLSDEPIVNYIKRMKIASFCMFKQSSYMGPDFLFEYEEKSIKISKPGMLIIGTGKRIGKTAVSSYIARLLSPENDVCIIAMGRGGPEHPQVIRGRQTEITPEFLLKLSRSGLHASSDYIEDAFFSKVTTVGCRRCGGGFSGKFFMSNIREGISIAEKLNPEIIIVEGSGASVPPIRADHTVCVISADQSWESIVGYLGLYRIMMSDLVFFTMCEEPLTNKRNIDFLESEILKYKSNIKIVKSIFRPEPASNIKGKKIFLALTANSLVEDKIKEYVEKKYNCEIIKVSFNLSNREKLKKELIECDNYDTILTELKASSVDLVTEFAVENKKYISYMNNVPIILEGEDHLKKLLKKLQVKKDVI
jgi:cyclic 2,3-diphosphoglycerate synthase